MRATTPVRSKASGGVVSRRVIEAIGVRSRDGIALPALGRSKAWRYTAMMLKKIAVATVLLGIAAAALYQFAGLRVALDGSGKWPRFVMRSPDYDALEARPREPASASAAASAGRVAAIGRTRRALRGRSGKRRRQSHAAGRGGCFARRGHVARILARLPGTQPGRTLPRDARSEPIGRAKGSRGCGSSRSGSAMRRLSSPRAVRSPLSSAGSRKWSPRTTSRRAVSCGRTDGTASSSKGWAGTARAPRRPTTRAHLRARGARRAAVSDARTGALVWRRNILRGERCRESDLGHVGRPAHRRPERRRLAWRLRGQVGCRVQQDDGRACMEGARRSSGLYLTHARDARRRAPDSRRERVPGDGPDDRRRAPAVGISLSTPMGISVAQPLLLGEDRVFLSAGYGRWRRSSG